MELSVDSVEEGLFHRREESRVKALSLIIKAFTENKNYEIAQTKFATIMFRCLNMVKHGSTNEICLATKAIGLLAMVIGPGDNAQELHEESISTYSELLKFENHTVNVKVLESLGVVAFVGAEDYLTTDTSLKIIWEFIQPNSAPNTMSKASSTPILAAAISAWSLILSTVDKWRLDHKYWKGTIPYFLSVLEEEEECVRVRAACVEALAIIFEMDCLDKFSTEAYATSNLQEWKAKTLEQIKRGCDPKWEILKYFGVFKGEHPLEISVDICGNNSLTFSTLSQLKKMKVLKHFLGDGFVTHMLKNEFLLQTFDFTPKDDDPSGPELFIPEREEIKVRYFSPDVKKKKCRQRLWKSPNSLSSKEKSKMMRKQRMEAEERKNSNLGD